MELSTWYGTIAIVLGLALFILGFAYTLTSEAIIFSMHQIGPTGECIHPPNTTCPISEINRLSTLKHLGIVLDTGIFLFGVFLLFRKKEPAKYGSTIKKAPPNLAGDEKRVVDLLLQSENFVFQNELAAKLSLSRVQLTRILDKLEAKGLIERRRRGMTNAILLK